MNDETCENFPPSREIKTSKTSAKRRFDFVRKIPNESYINHRTGVPLRWVQNYRPLSVTRLLINLFRIWPFT